jgi:hypothetical protein
VDFARHSVFSTVVVNGIPGRSPIPLLRQNSRAEIEGDASVPDSVREMEDGAREPSEHILFECNCSLGGDDVETSALNFFFTLCPRNHGALLAGGTVDFARHSVFSTVAVNGIPGRSPIPLLRQNSRAEIEGDASVS